MKVLAITPQYLPIMGGIEVFVDMLARYLRHRSIETIVVTNTDHRGMLPIHGVLNGTIVHRLDFSKALKAHDTARLLGCVQRLLEIAEDVRPDVIHMHTAVQPSAWAVDRMITKLSPRPAFLLTQHSLLEFVDRLGLVREFLLKADALTAVSQAVLQSAIAFSNRTAYSTVIYNGVEDFGDGANAYRSGPPYRLICAGRLQREKGFDLAIAALAKVRSAGVEADLTVIGTGEEGRSLHQQVLHHQLEGHVHFAGARDPKSTRAAIASSSLVLVPSRSREGFSLVAAEAAVSGVPCVASRIGGLVETVQDGITGILVEADGSEALASAIIDLLRNSSRREMLGTSARRLACERFNVDKCVDRYVELYRELTLQCGRC